MSPLVSLDSMPTVGQGSPWKGPENSDVKHQVNHSERCKGDVRGRILNLSLNFSNKNTSYLIQLAHAHLRPAEKFWEMALQEKNQTKYQ